MLRMVSYYSSIIEVRLGTIGLKSCVTCVIISVIGGQINDQMAVHRTRVTKQENGGAL